MQTSDVRLTMKSVRFQLQKNKLTEIENQGKTIFSVFNIFFIPTLKGC